MSSPSSEHRPYRRALAWSLVVLSVVVLGAVLRGIVNTLYPSRPAPAAVAPLDACRAGLSAVEQGIRGTLSKRFGAVSEPMSPVPESLELFGGLRGELDRLIAECALDGEDADRAHAAAAATALEEALRSASLLWDRHRADGLEHLRAARALLAPAAPPPAKEPSAKPAATR